jgi:AcrR family transcriptional regulator
VVKLDPECTPVKLADARERIMEVAIELFAERGFEGTSVRTIANRAQVNLASVNYHFKSKKNLLLEVMSKVIFEFKEKIKNLGLRPGLTVSQYAVDLYDVLVQDGKKCLNQFKLYIDMENLKDDTFEMDPYPIGFEQLSLMLKRELKDTVPLSERLWANNVIFSYVVHMAVMSVSQNGKKNIEKYFPDKRNTVRFYIKHLVDTLIRDLNKQYTDSKK